MSLEGGHKDLCHLADSTIVCNNQQMTASSYVGRVGGLAAALGIGAVVALSGAAVASAEPADTSTNSDSATAAAPTLRSPGRHASRSAGTSSHPRNDTPASKQIVRPVAAIPVGPVSTRSLPRIWSGAESLPAPTAGQAEIPVATVTTAPAPVAAPATVAHTALAMSVSALPDNALGGDPLAPAESPISWAVMAVARRSNQTVKAAATASADSGSSLFFNVTPSVTHTINPGQSSDGVITGSVVGTDPDSSPLNYSVTTAPVHGSVALGSDGSFTYTPDASVAATGTTDSFTVTVSDAGTGFHVHGIGGLLNLLTFGLLGSSGHTAANTISLTVAPFRVDNSAPTATASVGIPNASTGVVTGQVVATDADGDTLSYSGSTTTSKGVAVVNATTGAFTYTPTASARHAAAKIGATASATTDTFTVTVSDGHGGVTAVAVTVTISPKNTAPTSGTSTVGTPNASTGVVTGTVSATDADGDTLTYSGTGATSKGNVTVAANGGFTYTPTDAARASATSSTTDSFTVTAADGYGGSTAITVSVPVTPLAVVTNKVTYVFNYTSGSQYWTAAAKAALQNSADRVASYFIVSQPVTLTFNVTATDDSDSGTLASTGSDLTSSDRGFFNTVVQYKMLTGIDANGAADDGDIDVNFGINWAYGDYAGRSQYDFISTMMHELLHAYGFLAYIDEAGYNSGTTWTTFDSFIGTSTRTRVINPSTYRFLTVYNTNLTGGAGGLYFLGANAIAAYGGPVPLFTPNPWEAGSSVSHLDDDTFTGANAQLMNAYADTGLGIRTLSDIELGILKDIGYTV